MKTINIPMALAAGPDVGGFTTGGTSILLPSTVMGEEDVAMNARGEKTTWCHCTVVAVACVMSKIDSCRMSIFSACTHHSCFGAQCKTTQGLTPESILPFHDGPCKARYFPFRYRLRLGRDIFHCPFLLVLLCTGRRVYMIQMLTSSPGTPRLLDT